MELKSIETKNLLRLTNEESNSKKKELVNKKNEIANNKKEFIHKNRKIANNKKKLVHKDRELTKKDTYISNVKSLIENVYPLVCKEYVYISATTMYASRNQFKIGKLLISVDDCLLTIQKDRKVIVTSMFTFGRLLIMSYWKRGW